MSKKGIASVMTMVTTIILALAGFAVLLFFVIDVFDDQGQTERDLCEASIITRATVADAAQQAIPLQCTVEKICLTPTGDRDDCPQFAGEEDVQVIRLTGSLAEQRQTIVEESAKKMFDCWKMMGEGKLDIFGKAYTSFGISSLEAPTCVICSRVALGRSVNETLDAEIGPAFDAYLATTKPPESSLTYLELFTDRQFQNYPGVTLQNYSGDKLDGDLSYRGTARQVAFVFNQIKSVDYSTALQNYGLGVAAVGGTAFMLPGSAKVAGAIVSNPYALTGAVLVVGGGAVYATHNAYLGQSAAAGYCGGFTSTATEEAKAGCSTVQAVPYTVSNVNALCGGGIQGNL